MQDNTANNNSCGFDELQHCQKTVMLLEDGLSAKNRELSYQVGYNIFTLVIGLVAGLFLARLFRKK